MDQQTREVEEEVAPNKKLFVSGIDWKATDEDFRKAFERFGELVQATIVRYEDSGRSKGYGFVEYNSVEEATKAREEMDGATILERAIKVKFAYPKRAAV